MKYPKLTIVGVPKTFKIWDVEADVLLYALFVNAFLAKHKRAWLYDKYAPLKSLTDDDAQKMIEERKRYLWMMMLCFKFYGSTDIWKNLVGE